MYLPAARLSLFDVEVQNDFNIMVTCARSVHALTSFLVSSLQIFDGSVSLGRYSGRKKRKLLHRALSGNMSIVLVTETDQSRGFRAKIGEKQIVDYSYVNPTGVLLYKTSLNIRMKSKRFTITVAKDSEDRVEPTTTSENKHCMYN